MESGKKHVYAYNNQSNVAYSVNLSIHPSFARAYQKTRSTANFWWVRRGALGESRVGPAVGEAKPSLSWPMAGLQVFSWLPFMSDDVWWRGRGGTIELNEKLHLGNTIIDHSFFLSSSPWPLRLCSNLAYKTVYLPSKITVNFWCKGYRFHETMMMQSLRSSRIYETKLFYLFKDQLDHGKTISEKYLILYLSKIRTRILLEFWTWPCELFSQRDVSNFS